MALVHRWGFNEISGTNAADDIGSIDGTSTGAIPDTVNKEEGAASRFHDGIDDYTVFGNTTSFAWMHGKDNPSNFTWSVVFRMRLPTPEPDVAGGMFSTSTASPSQVGLDIFYDDRSGLPRSRRFGALIAAGLAGDEVLNTISSDDVYPNDTNFHIVIFTYDQSLGSNNLEIYLDNSLIHQASKVAGKSPSTANSNNPLRMGMVGSGILPLEINYDRVRIYDHVLTSGERAAIQNETFGVTGFPFFFGDRD